MYAEKEPKTKDYAVPKKKTLSKTISVIDDDDFKSLQSKKKEYDSDAEENQPVFVET
jgi:hypothetical protein